MAIGWIIGGIGGCRYGWRQFFEVRLSWVVGMVGHFDERLVFRAFENHWNHWVRLLVLVPKGKV